MTSTALAQLLSAGAPLPAAVGALVEVAGAAALDQVDGETPLLDALRARVDDALDAAPKDPNRAREVQLALRDLLALRFTAHDSQAEFSSTVFGVTAALTRGWLAQLTPAATEAWDLPVRPDDFGPWLQEVFERHRAIGHPIYDFLEHEASVADLQVFLAHEATLDGWFADVVALCQIGTSGVTKAEMATNFWDEVGEGDPLGTHRHLFDNARAVVGATNLSDECLSAEAFACGNLLHCLALFRSLRFECYGCLGATETAVPDRFAKILHGARRLALPDTFCAYYASHVEGDAAHSEGWIERVIGPASADRPDGVARIATGVLLRLATSEAYCDELLCRLGDSNRDDVRSSTTVDTTAVARP